ncbi:MAG: HTTM domain-containing protein [Candidatus Cyclobacteriaceae bacterium M2_1C_046]
MTEKLFKPVDNSPLVVFRIVFGLLVTAECWGAIATGWVKRAFIIPDHTFPFIDFQFLQPLPGDGMYYYYGLMGLLGIFISLGFYYRISMITFALLWAGSYLMQKTNYNNHYYLLMLLSFLMAIVPAHRYASVDVKRNPEIKSLSCPRWCILLFAVQMSLVYFFAGVAKLNPDWLMANPLDTWMRAKSSYYLIGPLLALPLAPWLFAYGGVAFDLFIAQGLWFKATRKAAFICGIFFHLINSAVFQVGIFPFLGIAACIFFFPPDKIRRLFLKNKPKFEAPAAAHDQSKKLVVSFLIIWFLFQIFLPVRHWMIPGDVGWTEEGHRLSWRMMLRQKSAYVRFEIVDQDTGKKWNVKPTEYLTPKQSGAIAGRPDMLWQFVQILKEDWKEKGYNNIAIYAKGSASLNRGPAQPLYDPEYNLAEAEWHRFGHEEWVLLEKD